MQKSLAIALTLLIATSTFSMYLYDKWTQAEEKHRILRVEYLGLLEEKGKCVEI